ncbi:MAG: peptide chain release factor 2 [Lachnospiraceae bacterium]|jgi:peptide chain release factor 2
MLELDQLKQKLETLKQPLKTLGDSLDLELKKQRIAEIQRYMEAPDFWDDVERSQKMTRELKSLQDTEKSYADLENRYNDIGMLIEMGNEENDPEAVDVVKESLDSLTQDLEKMRMSILLDGKYDNNNVILRLNAGAGGTEACDWAGMLYRMYTRWAERHGFSIEVLDELEGEEAGIKSVTVQINGENAYGLLKSEKGVHRLVRISPFNAAGKRQTSFVSCDVMPDIKEDLDVEIRPEDIRIDVYRSSGAGGQKVNKTSTAIRITHFPTGIVVTCQNERSQYQNKDKAMEILKSKLFMLKQQENEEKLSGIRGEVKENAWGSQIRSYVLQPYTMVKDHRTGMANSNANAVLDGDLDDFIAAYLRWIKTGEKVSDDTGSDD